MNARQLSGSSLDRHVRTAMTGAVAAMALGAAAYAGTPEAVLIEDQEITGLGEISAINDVDIDDMGRWIAKVTRQTPLTGGPALVGSEGVLAISGQNLNIGNPWTVASFGTPRRNNTGDWLSDILITDTGGDDLTGLLFNGELLIAEGDVVAAPGLPAGTVYDLILEAHPTDDDRVFIVAQVDEPSFPTVPYADWLGHYAFIELTLNRGVDGEVVSFSERALLRQGQAMPGASPGATVAEIRPLPHTTAVAPRGAWLLRVEALFPTDGPFVADANDWTVMRDGVVILEEGDPSAVPGRNHQFLDASGLDVNRNGDIAIKTNLAGSLADDEVIVINEAVRVVGEGDVLPDIAPYALESVGNANGPLFLGDDGSILWAGAWTNADSTNDEGLFRDLDLVIEEGVTFVAGLPVVEIDEGRKGYALSDNGRWGIVKGRLDDDGDDFTLDVAIRLDFGETCFGDTNGDDAIDGADLVTVLAAFGSSVSGGAADGDLTGDGRVDGADLVALLSVFGSTCG